MSHVFISYAHADKVHLDRLVAWLHEDESSRYGIWYDRDIQSGNNWRDEIADALDEAFAVLVIVTANSVKSLYCTYEWAYAMGQGIPIMPLAFDKVSIAKVPTPLTSKQFTNCTENIPASLKEQIRQLKSVPPQVAAINKAVYEAIYDTHRRFYILGWIGDGLKHHDEYITENVIGYFVEKASEAHRKLEVLVTDKAFAFSGKQYRYCWTLMDFLKRFSRLNYRFEFPYRDIPVLKFDHAWLRAFEYFDDDDGWWNKAIRPYFEKYHESESTNMEVFAEMMRVFPDINGSDAEMLIENARSYQKLKLTETANQPDAGN